MDKDSLEFAIYLLTHRDELEDAEVEAWLHDPVHRHLLGELAQIKHCLNRKQFDDLKPIEWKRLQRKVRTPKLRKRREWFSVAAVVLLLLCVGGWCWMYLKGEKEKQPIVAESAIRPGNMRAELILSGKQRILLGDKTISISDQQVKGIVNDSTGVLNYIQATTPAHELVYNTLKVPVGGFYRVVLPDGTRVWLNAASELKYPVSFASSKREVYLQGEAYFQVQKDTARQFIVHLQKADVTVLGTVFNINAYEEENHIYTTLAEGSVAFYSHLSEEQVLLKPGMQSDMNLMTGETRLKEVDPGVYTAWIDGRFVFQSISLDAMMRQLQRWYDFEIFYQKPAVKNYTFRGVINRDMEIREVLNIIEEMADVQFEIKGKTIVAR